MHSLDTADNTLAVLPTGAGKTIIFSHLVTILNKRWNARVLMLAHREILVNQTKEKLLQVWSEAPISIACASAGSKEYDEPLVIGSIQTFANIEPPHFDIVIIDEAHRIPPFNKKSQYKKVVESLRAVNPNLRILGVTATPYRLGHGFIYSDSCKSGHKNLFDNVCFKMTANDLIELGYLVPYRIKQAVNADFSHVRRINGGDYIVSDLEKEMTKDVHINSAVKAYQKYGENRQHVVVFGVTINHAEMLADAFSEMGTADVIHSKRPQQERQRVLDDFDEGKIQFLVNVGVLTEGWDCPKADCIIFARPTLSPALYVQMVGRGLRTAENKQDCLILDLVNNSDKHGDISDPVVIVPSKKQEKVQAKYWNTCPECKEQNHPKVSECVGCGYIFPAPEIRDLEIDLILQERVKNKIMELQRVSALRHISKKGNKLLKVSMCFDSGRAIPEVVNAYFDIEGQAHPYAKAKAQEWWQLMGGKQPVPDSVEDALNRFSELQLPAFMEIDFTGKYPKIKRWRVENDSRLAKVH